MINSMLSLGLLLGCSGSDSEVSEAENTTDEVVLLTAEDLQRTWVFKASDSTWRGQFEGDPGWTSLFNRDYQSALAGASGAGAVRMYAEYSAIYRQAALLHAHATNHVYGTDRQEEDGIDSLYLRGVANVVLGKYDNAKSDFVELTTDTLKGYAAQWQAVAEQGGWTSDTPIVGHFVTVPDVTKGSQFRPESVPHFDISTTLEGETSSVTDTTELWVRSRWYEAMADALAVENQMDTAWIDVFMTPWLTPMEEDLLSKPDDVLAKLSAADLDPAWLFLSRNLVAEDALFIYELQYSTDISETLKNWADKKSLLAALLLGCVVDGKLDVPKVLDAASSVEALLISEMKAAQGKEEPFYSMFADFAEQAILVAGVMVAEQNGQREDSGRLRSNARDLALQNSKDALFLTEYAAWDVSNRYPSRAQDMLHKYSQDFRAFKVAGHPLGMLQIRLGRSAGVPGAAN